MSNYDTPRMRPGLREPLRVDATTVGATTLAGAELASRAVPRLRSLATVLALLSVLFAVGALLTRQHASRVHLPVVSDFVFVVIGLTFVASTAMIVITFRRWSPSRISLVGLAFQLVGAFGIALMEEQGMRAPGGFSWVGIWILSFPLVPQSPRRAAVAAFGAVLATPAALSLAIASGARAPQPAELIAAVVISSSICAVLALFTNRVIHRLGREVVDAKRLGAYRLVEPLGRGGMGEVWRAEHRTLIRPAAIKLIRPELTSRDERTALSRFEREVQATAKLTSPHTVAIYDYGTATDGRLYYVMELLHGLDLENVVMKYGAMPAERVVHILRQVCESLSEAHAVGLIHRDIKPANLYLCSIGRQVDFVKVLDFGIAHDVHADVRFTAETAVAGTPAYVAPETAAYNVADARSDIYALGCVAYFALTGLLVFDGTSSAAMMAAHLRDEVVPPSRRAQRAIPADLEQVVMACLAKGPELRPQTMDELRRRLDEVDSSQRWNQAQSRAWWNHYAAA